MNIVGVSTVVTGGASGLGAATVRRLAAKGAKVVVADVQAELGDAIADEVGGGFVSTDVTNSDQVQAAVDAAVEMGPLRVLINCAGIGPPSRTLARDGTPLELDFFEMVVRINLVGTFNAIRLAAAAMAQTEALADGARGVIVNTAHRWRRSMGKSARRPTRHPSLESPA